MLTIWLSLGWVIVLVAGCSTEPYVHNSIEFNRDAKDFGRPVNNISGVTVCYNPYISSRQQVSQVAAKQCGIYNKTESYVSGDYKTCPLLTPAAAIYSCNAKPKKPTQGGAN